MKKFKIFIYILFIWFLAHIGYTIYDGLNDDGKTADVAVVLGNKVNEDGTLSKRLEERLNCAIDLYNKRRINTIIVSGGLGNKVF